MRCARVHHGPCDCLLRGALIGWEVRCIRFLSSNFNARQWLSKSSDLSPPCDYHHITVMPVELKGSCHCGAVAFTVQSSTPVPYQLCMCSICRKVGGTGGSVNLGAHAHTLQITKGKADISCGFISYTLRCSYMSLSVRGGTGYIKQC